MRGTKAKRIRKKVYGDTSLKIDRRYIAGWNGGIVNDGIRRQYQRAKKGKI